MKLIKLFVLGLSFVSFSVFANDVQEVVVSVAETEIKNNNQETTSDSVVQEASAVNQEKEEQPILTSSANS